MRREAYVVMAGDARLSGELLEVVGGSQKVLAAGDRTPAAWQVLEGAAGEMAAAALRGRSPNEIAHDLAAATGGDARMIEADTVALLDALRAAGWARPETIRHPDAELGRRLGVEILDGLISSEVERRLLAVVGSGTHAPATLYPSGSSSQEVRPERRRTKKIDLEPSLRDELADIVFDATSALHTPEITWAERPQLLCYETGDYFLLHRDRRPGGDVPVLEARRLAVVVGIGSAPYGGGDLVIRTQLDETPELDWPIHLSSRLGVVFDAEKQHQVRPVTEGSRLTLVTWLCAPLVSES